MKDAHQQFLDLMIKYRTRFDQLSAYAETIGNCTEARLSVECAVRLSHDILSLEALMETADEDEMVVPATPKTDEKLS